MRKIAYILCLSFMVSLLAISPVALAQDFDTEVTVYAGAEFLEEMNIPDPAKGKAADYQITRGEAITVIAKLFGYNGSGETQVPFADAKGELTGILRYALDLKMISESDAFRPNDAITYNEAFKMCTVALGYDYLAKMYGGWPAGYVRMAGECNLSDGLPTNENTISATGFYLFVENLLTAEMLEVEGMVETEIAYRKHTTILENFFDMYELEGIVTSTMHTGLYSLEDASGEQYISIDEKNYIYKGDSNYIGSNVKAYAYLDKDEIAVVVPYNNKTLAVPFSSVISVEGNILRYDVDNKDQKVRLDDVPAVIHNGKSLDVASPADYIGKNGYFTFIDNDGDNVYEVCNANEYRNIIVSGVNVIDGYINDKNGERKVDLSDDECTYFVYEDGVEKTLADISSGDLLSCYESNDGLLCTIVIENNSISGNLTGFAVGSDKIVVDDIGYLYSAYFKKYCLSKLKSGVDVKLYLSADGTVQYCDDGSSETAEFGYFVDVKKGSGLDSSITVKFVANNGAITITNVNDKFTFNGTTYTKSADISNIFFNADGSDKLGEQLIRYQLTSEGYLSLIDTACEEEGYISTNDDSKDNLKKFAYPTSDTSLVPSTIWMSKASCIVHPWYAVTSDSFIIQVNPDTSIDEEKRFAVRDLSWLQSNNNWPRTKAGVYNVDEYLRTGALVFNTAANDTVNDESLSGIVHSVTRALDNDDNEAYKIVIYRNSYFNDYYISDQELAQNLIMDENGNLIIGAGDQVRFSADASNQIAALQVDYDASEKILLRRNTNPMYLCYFYGGIYSMGNGMMTMIRATDDNTGLDTEFNKYAFKIPSSITIFDYKTGEITNGDISEVETYLQVGDECTRMLVKTDDLNMVSCTIYR